MLHTEKVKKAEGGSQSTDTVDGNSEHLSQQCRLLMTENLGSTLKYLVCKTKEEEIVLMPMKQMK